MSVIDLYDYHWLQRTMVSPSHLASVSATDSEGEWFGVKGRIMCYVLFHTIPHYYRVVSLTAKEFQRTYRVSKELFDEILADIRDVNKCNNPNMARGGPLVPS